MPELLHWLANNWGLIFAAAVAIGVIWRALRTLHPIMLDVVQFLEDWRGEPERPGVSARPGVMARLGEMESRTAELRPNGGGSIKDAITRIDQRSERLDERLSAVERVIVPDQPEPAPKLTRRKRAKSPTRD